MQYAIEDNLAIYSDTEEVKQFNLKEAVTGQKDPYARSKTKSV